MRVMVLLGPTLLAAWLIVFLNSSLVPWALLTRLVLALPEYAAEPSYPPPPPCLPAVADEAKPPPHSEGEPPFIKVEDLRAASNVSRAPGCPPEATGRLCRLEDVFDEILLISLPRATDRLARARRQLRELGVPYTLVHAVDARLMAGSAHLAKVIMKDPVDQHPGVLGLYLTHLGLMDYVTRSAGLERVLILEDDVTFCADFPRAFDARMRRMPSDWRMLWLGALVFEATYYKDAQALDHFIDAGLARPASIATTWAVALHREAAALMTEKMIISQKAMDQQGFADGVVKWPNQTVLMWPPVAVTNPYSGSGLGHTWLVTPSIWANDNGLDLANFDLARGYHVGGELGNDLRCVVGPDSAEVEAPWAYPEEFVVLREVMVNSSAECCAKCSTDFPRCQAWLWYPHTTNRTCVLSSNPTARVLSDEPAAPTAVSGRMVQEDSVPRVPNVVHFFPPRRDTTSARRRRLDVWSYISVLSAAINTEPDHIRWYHSLGGAGGGGGSLPEGPWWDECTLPLISSLHLIADSTTATSGEQREDDVRLGVLIDEGGILLDTDALVVRSFAPLRARQAVTLARDGLDRKLAGVGVVVAPRNASFLHRWRAKARDQHLADDYQSQAVALRLAERHSDEAKLLSHAAFYPRSYSPHHLKVAYQADDCASEHESFSTTPKLAN
ncbi:LPS glycosyltransferase subfamily protein [Acanthamoeba castellanii str. Neff]|uniref:LPS glycosyltransferase subfamily protein n=1 Tax=Acanthamoeba castellanii (strain ATCC 30010 / Neff) TaxID=1257118 RepID=L8GVH8_ACACF|nr:LPS glycosyltransferase subfamily protein [Acanthamoeba castellanii str. Neff]ELR17234.1 LPS glycosyltransferase subfamily protein [Acanthamoeba castellanii str. Neff]